MKLRYLTAPAVLLFMVCAGLIFRALGELPTDGTAGASRTGYGGEDYAVFLDKFKISSEDPRYEVISLQGEDASYFLLVNVAHKSGAALLENMSGSVENSPTLTIPVNAEDEVYGAHVSLLQSYFEARGYQVKMRAYEPVMFRSLVHSGHFDCVLLGRRESV